MHRQINGRIRRLRRTSRRGWRLSLLLSLAPALPFLHSAHASATTARALHLQITSPPTSATTGGAQEIVALETGQTIEREIGGGQTQQFQIKATTGEFVGLQIAQRGADLNERLFAPDGKLSAAFDEDARPQGEERADFVADATGIYRLEVAPNAKNAAGRYEVRLTERHAATAQEQQVYEARKLSSEASLLDRAGKYEEARTLAAHALDVAEKALGGDQIFVAYLLNQLGHIQRNRGELANAEATLERALTINEKLLGPEHPQTIQTILGLALIARSRSNNVKAGPLFEKALAVTEKTLGAEHPRTVTCLLDLGAFHFDMEDWTGAEHDYMRGLAIAERVLAPDDISTMRLLNNLGNLYRARDDYERGEAMLERALAIAEKTFGPDHPFVADVLQNLGIIARERKDYARALALYNRALAIREKSLGTEHPNVAALTNNIANLHHARGDYAKELELQARVLSVAEKAAGPYHGLTLTSLANTARAYAAEGDMADALKFQTLLDERGEIATSSDLTLGSERQKLAYLDSLAEDTSRSISFNLNLAPHDPAAAALAALVVLESKGRVLDALSDSTAALRQRAAPEDQQLLDRLSAVEADLAKLVLNGLQKRARADYQQQLAVREAEKERLEAEISTRSAEFRAQSQPVTLAAVQAAIPRGAALVEFAIYRPYDPKAVSDHEAYGAPRYVAYVVRHEGAAQGVVLGEAQAIDARVDALRQALTDPQRADVRQLARAVDEQLIRPLRPLLGDATQLLISPDGELNLLPFQALVDEQGRYLIERYAFTYLTSGRDLLRLQVARDNRSGPLVVANPTFGETAASQSVKSSAKLVEPNARRRSVTGARSLSELYFAPLDATEQEAEAIRRFFPDANLLTGARATKAALRQAVAPRILHIATHGFFLQAPAGSKAQSATAKTRDADVETESAANPLLRSGLALAGANLRGGAGVASDGILTALEASGLNLWGTKLVVLSACDTGLGEVRNGEGVYGLRRAFVLAGAESLVMSLWPASDYSTRTLMTRYYQNLQRGLGRGAALRQVQLDMIKRDPKLHPFYWANFIQSGEWASLDGRR